MEFPYSKAYLRWELIFAVVQISIGVISILLDSMSIIFQYGWPVIGIINLYRNCRERSKPLIRLDNQVLCVYDPIFWSDIIDVSEFKRAEMTDTSIILWLDDFKRTVKTDQLSKTDRHKLFDQINNILQNSVNH